MHEQPHTPVRAARVTKHVEFRRLARRLGSIEPRILKAWRRRQSDLADATALLRSRLDAVRHRDCGNILEMSEPLDELWMLFLSEATPGTRMWRDGWKTEPRIQQLTIRDLLVAFASARMHVALEVIAVSMSRDAPKALTAATALLLAHSHLDAAEETLKVANGLANP